MKEYVINDDDDDDDLLELRVDPAAPVPLHLQTALATLLLVCGGHAAAPRGLPLAPSPAAVQCPAGGCSASSVDCLLPCLKLRSGSVFCNYTMSFSVSENVMIKTLNYFNV